MAKKTAKKAAKKTSAAKKPPAKKGAKKPVAGKKAGRAPAAAPRTGPVSSGTGPTPHEIGRAVVEHVNSGAHGDEPLWDRFWSDDFVSVEGMGMQWGGRKAVEQKNAEWMNARIVRGASAEGPYVGATGFAVRYRIDVEEKASGLRNIMEEVGVYTVKDGKVVREEFMYGGTTPV